MTSIEMLIAAIAADAQEATATKYVLPGFSITAVFALGQWLPSAFSPVVGGIP